MSGKPPPGKGRNNYGNGKDTGGWKKTGGGSSQQFSKWNWPDTVDRFLQTSPGIPRGQAYLEYQQAQALGSPGAPPPPIPPPMRHS